MRSSAKGVSGGVYRAGGGRFDYPTAAAAAILGGMDTDTSPATAATDGPAGGGIGDGDFSRLCGDGFDPVGAITAAVQAAEDSGGTPTEYAPDEIDSRTYASPPPRRRFTVQVEIKYRGRGRPMPYDLEPE